MMKQTISTLTMVCLFLMGGMTFSYGQAFEKGAKLLDVGIGIGGNIIPKGAKGIPPVGISFELGTSDNLSLGAYAGYSSASQNVWGNIDYKWQFIILGARGSYHFHFGPENLDPYIGLLLGYNIASAKVTGGTLPPGVNAVSAGGFTWGGHIGARYFFSPSIGVFAELGYGISILNAGLAFKF